MKKSMELKLNALYDFLIEFKNQNGYCPSVREMCEELQINSTSTITYYLNHLERMGKIRRGASKNRAIEIVQDRSEKTKGDAILQVISSYQPIPMLGNITAGEPILAVENYEEVFYMPTGLFRGDDLFMLTVSGESMIEAGIMDGDKVVIRKQDTAENGEIVKADMTNEKIVEVPNTLQEKDILIEIISATLLLSGIGIIIYAKKKSKNRK